VTALLFVDADPARAVLAAAVARSKGLDAYAEGEATAEVSLVLGEIGLAPMPGAAPAGAERVEVVRLVGDAGLGGADDFERRVRARMLRDRLERAAERLAPG
jgi:hypothetical protein